MSVSIAHSGRLAGQTPATGKPRGRCPGWEVDHAIPLKCGGADHRSNMQWLTVEAHKDKTRREARLCRVKRMDSPRQV